MFHRLATTTALAVLVVVSSGPVRAMCYPLVRPTERVLVSGDQRLFLFHRNGVQHLILENGFKGQARDFGLLLPLPSPPEVKKVDRQFFRQLWQLTPQPTIRRLGGPTGLASAKADASAVQVVSRQVAGIFEAVTLKATSTEAFMDWLDRHGYAHPADAEPVFRHYVKKRWFFVAIRITPGQAGQQFDGALPPMGFGSSSSDVGNQSRR